MYMIHWSNLSKIHNNMKLTDCNRKFVFISLSVSLFTDGHVVDWDYVHESPGREVRRGGG